MSDVRDNQKEAHSARIALRQAEESLYEHRNRLRSKQNQLANALRQGQAGNQAAQVLRREIRLLEALIDEESLAVDRAKQDLARLLREFELLDRPWELVEQLNDNLPFLLFPVRIETRFMTVDDGKQLWVRIFPDDIAAQSHEKTLTTDELNSSRAYWREFWLASQEIDDAEQTKIEKGAWRALAEAYGGTRAAWIASETKPLTLEVDNPDDLEFPSSDPEVLKEESWSQAPRSNIMPDRFVVMAYSGDKEIIRSMGNLIPNPLVLGPDPQKAEDEYRQQEGELLVGEEIAWIYDFDNALEVGMALKIPLEEPFASQGFDRLLVLGLRISSDEDESQALLEELFENHHYSPDGMSVLPQGTPTNNTDDKESGFSSQDSGAESSYGIETGDPLFTPTDDPQEKKDGQRLAEALGILYEPLHHVQGAGQRDAAEALQINKSLWHGTLGYYLEEMLGLDLNTVGLTREFFTGYVTGRGPLPAIRVGSQPYGVLLTSDFSTWKWSRKLDGDRFIFLERLHQVASQAEDGWRSLLENVAHVGSSGDPYQNLLDTLGLQATSAEHYRRHAVGKQYIWNLAAFQGGSFLGPEVNSTLKQQALALLQELGFDFEQPPPLFELPFLGDHQKMTDPLVDDIAAEETEKLSETGQLKSIYKIPDPDPDNANASPETNYIGWLAHSSFDDIKAQNFRNHDDEPLPAPRALMYRMLRGALLQAYYDTTMKLYTSHQRLPEAARQEVELPNVETGRTVTRWEFMDAEISRVMPDLSPLQGVSIGQFLQTDEGLAQPEALSLGEVRECLKSLIEVPTASLERIFVEHLDLCSYRLDAWQMGCFNRRLQQQRFPLDAQGELQDRVEGIYLGAFGWVEDLRPDALVEVENPSVPTSLHDPQRDGALFEQQDNAGFIHAPSLNHAVTAAVLRSAYITHFDPQDPEKMAVNLSSERVRTALDFLEGIRNGQELGGLLGYQLERGLHDRHGDPSLNQYIPFIRQKYPLVADKITEDEQGEQVETKEARNVVDGYALLEVAFLKKDPLEYPYAIDGLPTDAGAPHALAIQAEVSRMADSLDAIKDLALAEGVYQVTQGNFDRAGAMLKAFTEGNNPIEPEIVRTPHSGAALIQRVTLHLESGAGSPKLINWPAPPEISSSRAIMEPRLNKWLGDLLPSAGKIQYTVRLGDVAPQHKTLASLGLQPIDLLYLIGDDLADEMTELEMRIAYESRRGAGQGDSVIVKIDFRAELPDPEGVTLFELLPLLRHLRDLVTGCRPLAADDFVLPSETPGDTDVESNPKGVDLVDLHNRVRSASVDFGDAVDALKDAANAVNVEAGALRGSLQRLADFGVADAFPLSSEGALDLLAGQANSIQEIVKQKREMADRLVTAGNDINLTDEERVASYHDASQEMFGPAFKLIPVFDFNNQAEMQAAADFRDTDPDVNLTRHNHDNPHIVEEWLQGAARVCDKVGVVDAVNIFSGALNRPSLDLKPLQIPFRKNDHWVAVTYPEVNPEDADKPDVFIPDGDFLSVVQWLPATGFDPVNKQSGLLVGEWIENIASQQQTTGIAVHYNQATTEPPQALLLAITPEVTGAWNWDKLVGILHNTLDRAKLRAVEPDQLNNTAYGHLLPAIISAVSSYPYATISTDFVHQTAEMASNLTPDNG